MLNGQDVAQERKQAEDKKGHLRMLHNAQLCIVLKMKSLIKTYIINYYWMYK